MDVTPGGIWPEGPQCLLPDPTHSTELQQRDLRHDEYSGCVPLGKHDSAQQPVWRVPGYLYISPFANPCLQMRKLKYKVTFDLNSLIGTNSGIFPYPLIDLCFLFSR